MPFTMPLTDISGLRPSQSGSLVIAWGNNRFGQLGVPETSDERERGRADFMQHVPMIIPAFTDRPVSALSCRDHFCIALVAGDGVYGWGSADQGQLGDRRGAHMVSSPVRLAFTHHKAIVAIAAGSFHALALRQENIVRASIRQTCALQARAHAALTSSDGGGGACGRCYHGAVTAEASWDGAGQRSPTRPGRQNCPTCAPRSPRAANIPSPSTWTAQCGRGVTTPTVSWAARAACAASRSGCRSAAGRR